jgi:hypothetical protein
MTNEMKRGIKRIFVNIMRAIYEKIKCNIILNGEKRKLFPLKSGRKKMCSITPPLFSIFLEFLTRAMRQEEENKKCKVKGRGQTSLFADDMRPCTQKS